MKLSYLNSNKNCFNDLDGRGNDHCVVYPGNGMDLIPTIQWESLREGIDDYKYIAMLETLIAKNPTRGEQAKAYLEKLREAVLIDYKLYQEMYHDPLYFHINSHWKTERYHKERRKIARWIQKLMASH